MEVLFRLSPGPDETAAAEQWFNRRPDELGHLARRWFNVMMSQGHDVLARIHDGCPVACIVDVPFAYVNVFTAHVNVGFYAGADLTDLKDLLTGTGKRLRHVKVSPVVALDEAAMSALIKAAYLDIKRKIASA